MKLIKGQRWIDTAVIPGIVVEVCETTEEFSPEIRSILFKCKKFNYRYDDGIVEFGSVSMKNWKLLLNQEAINIGQN